MKKAFKYINADASSAVVVFLVALPLCLGIALGSNAPLFSGIIAGVTGGIIIGALSGSQLSVSGPAAGLTAIVASAIGKMPVYEAFLVAVVLSGIFQVILGFLKAGMLGDYVPTSVIKGMLAAIGVILILKQIPHLVGYDTDYIGDETFRQHDTKNTFSEISGAFKSITPLAAVIGLTAILIQLLWDKVLVKKSNIFQFIPAPLVVVITGVFMVKLGLAAGNGYVLKPGQMVAIPVANSAGEFLSFFTMPHFQYLKLPLVWTTAITIAIVASLETLLSIEAADKLDPFHRVTPTNRELKAQGIGNLVSGMLGGLPITSVVVRTSVNINSGGKTKMSAILHGLLLLLCVAFIPGVLNLIPLSALAGVLIYTGYKLAKPALFKDFYVKGWDQFVPFVVTILAIIFTDLLVGIIVGIAVGLFFVLRSNFRSAVFVVNDKDKYLFRLRKDVSFLNKALLRNKLEQIPENSEVLIDVANADFIDKDVIEVINDFLYHAHLKGIKVEVRKSPNKSTHKFIHTTPAMSV
ncbi:SulP family inorganic anion transporter [Filimonas effusa]|uniref:SulP family inorganic anion transporter n=1 Tax=Filimonas effusa TaxID=2508721 RepID=A0A4V1MA37_9BACT|nr:SulP family inorganic anion transporter [Filimonas effusa]RXK83814.1 SulP family inorganic anion transporter [Filimonas effusa]